MSGTAHIPARPSWICTWCGEPWPCTEKRRRLCADYATRPTALRLMMAMRVADAAEDLREVDVVHLRARFLGWLPRHPGHRPSRATTG